MRYAIALFAVLAFTPVARAQHVLDFQTVASPSLDGGSALLTIEVDQISRLAGSTVILQDFPVTNDKAADLILKPLDAPVDGRTHIECGGRQLIPSGVACWSGVIRDEPGSRVYLSTANGYLFASIVHSDGTSHIVAPDRRPSGKHQYRSIAMSDLLATDTVRPLFCINEDRPEMDNPHGPTTATTFSMTKPLAYRSLLEAEIAVEADSCFFAAAGGDESLVTAYINALFAMSSAIYEDEAQITFHIPWLKLWASGDPYNVKGDAYALPDTVRHYWQAHYSDVKRDIAHVMTSIGYGGGGFGWFGACSNDWSYSVSSPRTHASFPTFAFTYDAYIVSHEIGHNFGLPHSHNCYWAPPLDTCYTTDDPTLQLNDACYGLPVTPRKSTGTIMSYCANANYALSGNDIREYKLEMTFSKRVADTLRRNAQTYTCITEPETPTIRLLEPRGGIALRADTTINLVWTTAHVSAVRLRYSTNGGSDWSTIRDNVPVTDGSLSWAVPNVGTMNGVIEVADASNPAVADTSLLPITVTAHASVPAAQSLSVIGQYEVFDILGHLVGSGEGDPLSSIPAALPHGMYIIRMVDRASVRSFRWSR